MEPKFFPTPADFRLWLSAHHSSASELLVGFYKKDSGRPSITWPESVDQALCFGWIDGVRRSLGPDAYTIRFTPRKAGSHWSNVNIARVAELRASGLMTPAGLAAFEARSPERSGRASFEQQDVALPSSFVAEFQAAAGAWEFWLAQPPGYRKTATWWVISAKREETRRKRLATLIEDSANGLRIKELRR
ncbi:YdeI/OmpD-associated family protein [Lentzea sp. NBRC 105346]|uniref:YdeI/OmpD-associated family protein n=1 Tax=Lentzea sp. NBRC 105346 TaxID=3032205 RepID=UPI0025564F03|nr:YdeI/OmpD-associated family protein [Lentzea sp. NBRC 105346]